MIKNEVKIGSFTQNESKDYSDILDREIARTFLYQKQGKSGMKFGGTYELDLISGTTGCDVEYLTFNALSNFRADNGFRLPNRKEHYWSGSPMRAGKNGPWKNQYQNWNIDYIQLYSDRTKLLYYKSDIIKKYVKNVIYREVAGWDEKNRYFIQIPFEENKNLVEYWIRDENGYWIKTEY